MDGGLIPPYDVPPDEEPPVEVLDVLRARVDELRTTLDAIEGERFDERTEALIWWLRQALDAYDHGDPDLLVWTFTRVPRERPGPASWRSGLWTILGRGS